MSGQPPASEQPAWDDPLAPAGISWIMAMNYAARMFRMADEGMSGKKFVNVEWHSTLCAVGQGWVAYAREITTHSRAPR